ncbi:MAG: tRNA (cytidine(56)-2'-O)-methyltransferase [Candidatus Hadarchaeales archaeon]
MARVSVLRLGHRFIRDKRTSTHLGLVARAFGADEVIFAGAVDPEVEESLRKVVELWGGRFSVRSGATWMEEIRKWKEGGGVVVHLTMYGLPVDEVIPMLRGRDILVVVGGEKVPGEVFQQADFNVAISGQPHSEIAALAVFLDRLFGGKELEKEFEGWRLRVVPSERGKNVVKR